MTTYVYETIPSKPSEKPEIYEIRQNMTDEPLTKHPETGEPIRRVVLGGFGILSSAGSRKSPGPARSGGCGPDCNCCG